jgi:hypothetical protein
MLSFSALLLLLLAHSLFQALILHEPVSDNPYANMALIFCFIAFFLIMGSFFIHAARKLIRVFGSHGAQALALKVPKDLAEKEIPESDYLWVRAVCEEYPFLRDRLALCKNANDNLTYATMQMLWFDVVRLDNHKSDQKIPLAESSQILAADYRPFFFGIRYAKIEIDPKPFLGGLLIALVASSHVNHAAHRPVSIEYLRFIELPALKLLLLAVAVWLLGSFYIRMMRRTDKAAPPATAESLNLIANTQFRKTSRGKETKSGTPRINPGACGSKPGPDQAPLDANR